MDIETLSRPMTPNEIRRARQALGLTQTGLEGLCGLSNNGGRVVRRWESGSRVISGTCDLIIKIMLVLGVEKVREIQGKNGHEEQGKNCF